MKNIFLVNFILLHGYSLDNSSLMFGKMGYSLILFEYSHYFKDALAESKPPIKYPLSLYL